MSIVSYAQNFEDVILWRALGHVQGGLYIDIGAQHPIVDSVSLAFHEAGWEGIHFEPVPAYAAMLRQARPGDTVLEVALGAEEGVLQLHVIDDSGLSTAVGTIAEQHRQDGGHDAHRVTVPMLTLTSALRHLAGREVHWMKIDVEGFEEQVLRGWDSRTLRPWVLVVEATVPGSPRTEYSTWDPLVLAAGYQFVYFDGLNRFYVAREHGELVDAFAAPPNVFDGAQLSGLSSSAWCHRVASQAAQAQQESASQAVWLRNEWDAAAARADHLAAELAREHAAAEHTLQHTHAAAEQALQQTRAEYEQALQQHRDAIEQARQAHEAIEHAFQLQAVKLTQSEFERDALQNSAQELAARLAQTENGDVAAKRTLQEKIDELQHWSHHWYLIAEEREASRRDLLNSASWRLTAPLRKTSAALRFSKRSLVQLPARSRQASRSFAQRAARWAVRRVLSNQTLSEMARSVLASHPALKRRLRGIASSTTLPPHASAPAGSAAASQPHALNERAGRLYLAMRKYNLEKQK